MVWFVSCEDSFLRGMIAKELLKENDREETEMEDSWLVETWLEKVNDNMYGHIKQEAQWSSD